MTSTADFPSVTIPEGAELHRIHRRSTHPAWFSSSGSERFDPPVSHRARYGSCYIAFDAMASYLEVFGRMDAVSSTDIHRRALSRLTTDRALTLADLTDRSVLGTFRITASVSTGSDYEPSQQLSAELFDAGFDGIRYRVRHDPALAHEAVAMFGEPGQHEERFDEIKTSDIPEHLIEGGCCGFGITIIPSVKLI